MAQGGVGAMQKRKNTFDESVHGKRAIGRPELEVIRPAVMPKPLNFILGAKVGNAWRWSR